MKRNVKKGSAIYEYLQSTGLLEHGTNEEIIAAKKLYWSELRRVWKHVHRKEYKSFTVSFTSKQHELLIKAANASNNSINLFIKNVCLHVLLNTSSIDKKTIGKVREALMLFHSRLQSLAEKPGNSIHDIIHELTILENNILTALMHTKSVDRVD